MIKPKIKIISGFVKHRVDTRTDEGFNDIDDIMVSELTRVFGERVDWEERGYIDGDDDEIIAFAERLILYMHQEDIKI